MTRPKAPTRELISSVQLGGYDHPTIGYLDQLLKPEDLECSVVMYVCGVAYINKYKTPNWEFRVAQAAYEKELAVYSIEQSREDQRTRDLMKKFKMLSDDQQAQLLAEAESLGER